MGVALKKAEADTGYEADFYSWAMAQAKLLREGKLGDIDIANIAEELETLGRSERSALRSHYEILTLHLLKAAYQPKMHTKSWNASIANARNQIARLIEDNPGLKPQRDELFEMAYQDARRVAAAETGLLLKEFPRQAPFSRTNAEDFSFMPKPVKIIER